MIEKSEGVLIDKKSKSDTDILKIDLQKVHSESLKVTHIFKKSPTDTKKVCYLNHDLGAIFGGARFLLFSQDQDFAPYFQDHTLKRSGHFLIYQRNFRVSMVLFIFSITFLQKSMSGRTFIKILITFKIKTKNFRSNFSLFDHTFSLINLSLSTPFKKSQGGNHANSS